MASWLTDLGMGFSNCLDPMIFLSSIAGVMLGILIGFIPGLGPAVAISLAIPITHTMGILPAIALMLGIYKGGTYGGSISAILINTPGTPAAAATLFDGWPMAQQGKAGKALHMALLASVFGDGVGMLILCVVAMPVAAIAMKFGPAELTCLLLFAMTIVGSLGGKSLLKGLLATILGIMLSTTGMDPMSGDYRFTWGFLYFEDGFAIIPMVIGLFAMAEVFRQVAKVDGSLKASLLPPPKHPDDNRVTWAEYRRCLPVMLQSSIIGVGVGALPGTGSTTAAFFCYGAAQQRSKYPEEFGKGSIEGVAAAESGNNAVCGGALVPMLTLGVPGDVVTAILMSALMVHGIHVGPNIFVDHREFMFTLFGLALVSVAMLFVCGRVAVSSLRNLASLPQAAVMPLVMLLCVLGAYATNNEMADVWFMLFMGLVGLVLSALEIPLAPLIIGFILSPSLEQAFRQALLLSDGSYWTFVTKPIALFFLALALLSCLHIARMSRRRMLSVR